LRRPRLSGNIPLTPSGCRGFPDKRGVKPEEAER
jgi:hypothetical protein